MFSNNPFAELSLLIPSIYQQVFTILMILLVIIGTSLDIIHKKNVKYFFANAKKAKQQAKRTLNQSQKTKVILKTVTNEILTTSELGLGKRRMAHLLGMYGTILFWITSIIILSVVTLKTRRPANISKSLIIYWCLVIPLGIYLIGGGFLITAVPSSSWGGLTLTLVLTLCSASIALPLGIFLALGRVSKIYFIRSISRLY